MGIRTSFFAHGLCRHIVLALALLSYAAAFAQDAQAIRPLPAGPPQAALPCKPFLEWMLDPGDSLRIQDVASVERQAAFVPLDDRFPPHQGGTLWLRFTLEPRALENRPPQLLLDMGDGVPGTPLLFAPQSTAFADAAQWRDIRPSRRALFLLPEAQTTPQTMYIRLEGLPGPWFTPMLRTAHDAATALERLIHPAILVTLGVVMLLCLLRGLSERGQWRIWTGLYTGAALACAVYGMPAAPGGTVPLSALPGVLAPGLALMLLPHVGRHLMQTRDRARGLDIQYLLLSLPGAALALLPLVPGHAWTSYYLALWPLATALFVPTSLGAWLSGLPGARRFLLACLVSMLGAAAGILGMYAVASPLSAAAPLLGVSLGALLIAGTAVPRGYAPEAGGEAGPPARNEAAQDFSQGFSKDFVDGLRLVPPDELQESVQAPPPSAPEAEQSAALEARLRPQLDLLLRESAELAQCALPPVARQHAEAVADAGRALDALLRVMYDAPHTPDPVRMTEEAPEAGEPMNAPDAEPPLDLPAPVEYGPGHAPTGELFVPLSLDRNLSLDSAPFLPVAPDAAPLSVELPGERSVELSLPSLHGERAAPRRDAVEWVEEASPSAHAVQDRYGYQSADEWVGEPVPVPGSVSVSSSDSKLQHYLEAGDDPLLRPFDRQALQPENAEANREEAASLSFLNARQGGLLDWVNGARAARTAQPPAYAADTRQGSQSADEWVGEPTPRVAPAQPPVSAADTRQRSQSADEWVGEPTPRVAPAQPPVSAADTRYGPQSADEWVGEPTPRAAPAPVVRMTAPARPRISAPPAPREMPGPTYEDFIPLRLTNAQTLPPLAPTAIQERAAPLPDSSVQAALQRTHPDTTDAGPSPTGLVKAARDMVSRVKSRVELPVTEAGRNMPRQAEAVKRPAPSGGAVEGIQPLIPGLLASLDEAMDDVRRGFSKADTIAVEEAAARIAARADAYGLRILARMARCVEMAAAARDKDALANILPDLETAVERNRIALQPKKQGS